MKSVSSLRDKGFRGIGARWGWDSAWLIVEYKTSALKKQVGDDEMIHHSYICISETAGGTKVSTKSADEPLCRQLRHELGQPDLRIRPVAEG